MLTKHSLREQKQSSRRKTTNVTFVNELPTNHSKCRGNKVIAFGSQKIGVEVNIKNHAVQRI